MSDINVQLKDGASAVLPDSATVAEALKKLDRDVAKQALAAKVRGHEVDLAAPLSTLASENGDSKNGVVEIDPIVPDPRWS